MLQAGADIPSVADPRVAKWSTVQARRLARLSPAQRAALVLERYPELRALPNSDWQRLSAAATFTVLFGVSSRHFAKLELTAMQGILASAGVEHTRRLDLSVRTILDALRIRYGIATPGAITLGMWEEWGDTGRMGALTAPIRAYAAAVNVHVSGYREHLSHSYQDRLSHLFLPPLPGQFRRRFVPEHEQHVVARQRRKAKTDVVSECYCHPSADARALRVDGPVYPVVQSADRSS
jgi:hypothetical protein